MQEQLCREFVEKNGYELVEIFIEEGETAKNTNRTKLKELWAFCCSKANNIRYIVAYRSDRIARNRDDYRELGFRRRKYGLRFRYVTQLFDDTPSGRFMEEMYANMAHFDNDIRTENAMNGSRQAMREGRYVWKAPIGYTNALVNGKSTIVQTEHAPLVLSVFREIESGLYSTEEVWRRSFEQGLTRTGKLLGRSHFHRLVRNPVYAGWIEKFGEVHKGAFLPIVSQALFDVVQLRLNSRIHPMKFYNRENPDFPLRQIIVNPEGMKLRGYWAQGRRKKYPFYSFGLPKTTIRKEFLEEKFKRFLDKFELDAIFLDAISNNLIYHFKNAEKKQAADRSKLEGRKREIFAEMGHYSKNEYAGIIDRDLLLYQVAELKQELLGVEQRLQSLDSKTYDVDELLKYAKKLLRRPSRFWQALVPEVKKRFQRFVFPLGVIFENFELRTGKICKLFKLKEELKDCISLIVPDSESGKNTPDRPGFRKKHALLCKDKAFWTEIADELQELSATPPPLRTGRVSHEPSHTLADFR